MRIVRFGRGRHLIETTVHSAFSTRQPCNPRLCTARILRGAVRSSVWGSPRGAWHGRGIARLASRGQGIAGESSEVRAQGWRAAEVAGEWAGCEQQCRGRGQMGRRNCRDRSRSEPRPRCGVPARFSTNPRVAYACPAQRPPAWPTHTRWAAVGWLRRPPVASHAQ